MEELLEMTKKEIDRLNLIKQVQAKLISQVKAASLLGITTRQLRTLQRNVELSGPKGIISKRRGKLSNNRKSADFKKRVLTLIQDKYGGFGPTLAAEKLEELHGLNISSETLRLWMIENHIWIPRVSRRKTHLPRPRRDCFGELIQGDGSPDHWFGEDQPQANLTVLVDDATSCLTGLVFSPTETSQSYFDALEQHLRRYGRPNAIYVDHSAVFEAKRGRKRNGTQLERALKELDIRLIFANSPQAKGRVERANRTLQDRLKKELMIRGIKTIPEANDFAKEFMDSYNTKFSKKPMNSFNAHRSLEGYNLERILRPYETRTLLSDLSFQYNNQFFKLQEISGYRRARGRKIEVRKTKEGKIRAFIGDREIECVPVGNDPPAELSRREVVTEILLPKSAPSRKHPWKKYGYQLARENALRKKLKERELKVV